MTPAEVISLGLVVTPYQADLIAEAMNLKRAFERLDSKNAGQLVQSVASLALARAITAQTAEMRLARSQTTQRGGNDGNPNA
ncbi:hypothetical protein [Chitinibacter tainanensis]|uniref:hypothetical protein n=1 Tax=Chitinibacter tainanensis TaxID=230667 RepID=UPI0023563FF7|nr:hypothetical protein [Chitinibacter tainanensis]